MPSQLSRQSVRLLTDWSQVRALSMALQWAHSLARQSVRLITGRSWVRTPLGPCLLCIRLLRWCSPANHFGLSSRRLGFESRPEHFIFCQDFLWFLCILTFLKAGVPERPKGTGLGPVDAGLPGFESLLPHSYKIIHLFMPGQGRRSSYGTVDPVTRVQISAPAP